TCAHRFTAHDQQSTTRTRTPRPHNPQSAIHNPQSLAPSAQPARLAPMLAQQGGSFRLFRFAGIQVYLHWSWLLVAAIELSSRRGVYVSVGWNVAEYLSLFGIVLLHEFGHALACRQVGGHAHHIVLWP